jgi:geranylgeranyl diphosphate synthase type I
MTGPSATGAGAAAIEASRLRERVQDTLCAFLDAQAAVVLELGEELAAPMRTLSTLVAGGKHLRPAFCYWGYRATGGPDGPEIVRAAAALELLHVSALVHDDVMDGSDLRRGRPAAHRQFAKLHAEAGWASDAEAFGTGAAILLGDLTLVWADQLLHSCGVPGDRLAAAVRVFDTMRTEVIGGQYLDLVAQASGGADAARAMRVIRYKTAKYSIERPLQLGGALGAAAPELQDAFTAVGIPLGEAFQLRDDLLGVFGDPGLTGKPAGDDLREGKATVLVAKAWESAGSTARAVLSRDLGDPNLDADGVARLRAVLVDTGAVDEVEKLIDSLTRQAEEALDAAPVADPTCRAVLAELTVAATRRSV